MIAPIAEIISDPPMATAETSAVNPAVADTRPMPSKVNPPPTAAIPRPTTSIPAPSPRMLGIAELNSLAAMPMTAKEPAIAISPLARSSQLRLAKLLHTEANIFIPAPIAISARLVVNIRLLFDVSFENAAISRSRPPIPTKPFPMDSQSISPKVLQTDAIILRAAPIAISARLEANIPLFLLSLDVRNDISISRPPTPTSPFAICSQSMSANDLQADTNILRDAPIAIKAMLEDIIPLFLLSLEVKKESSNIKPPTPTSPFAISSQFIWAKVLHAEASIFMPAPIAIRAKLDENIPLFLLSLEVNNDSSSSNPPTLTSPFAISSQLI